MPRKRSLPNALICLIAPGRTTALLVTTLFVLTTIGAIHIVVHHARIDGDPTNLLSPKLPFRMAQAEFAERFHGIDDTLVAVIETSSPERARQLAGELAENLENNEMIERVYVPGRGPFFDRHNLLYLKTGQLEDLGTRLAAIAPILSRLARDPSLEELLRILQISLENQTVDPEEFASLCNAVSNVTHEAIDGRESTFSWQDLIAPSGISDSGAMSVMLVHPAPGDDRLESGRRAMAVIRREALALGLSADGEDRLRITGGLAMRMEQLELSSRGVFITGPVALLLVIIVLSIALRSPRLILATLLTLVAGLSITAAFATLLGPLNLISISFGVLYIGLGVDFAIHLALHYRAASREDGQLTPPAAAVAAAIRRTGGALCLCAMTTAIAFYAFAPTSFRGVAELGIIAGTGMLVALVSTLVFMPALIVGLARLSHKSSTASPDAGTGVALACSATPLSGRWQPGFTRVALPTSDPPTSDPPLSASRDEFRETSGLGPIESRAVKPNPRHLGLGSRPAWSRWYVLAPTLLAIPAAIALLPWVRFDADPANLLPPDSEAASALRSLRTAEQPVGWSIFVLADEPARVKELANTFASIDGVRKVHSVFSWIPGDQSAKLEALDELKWLIGPSLLAVAPPSYPKSPPNTGGLKSLRDVVTDRLSETDSSSNQHLVGLKQALDRALSHAEALSSEERSAFLRELERRMIGELPELIDGLNTALSAGPVGMDDLPGDVRSQWISPDGRYRLNIDISVSPQDPAAMKELISRIEAITPRISGGPVGEIKAADAIISAFAQATTLALAGVTLILFIKLRGAYLVFSVLVPLLVGGLFTAGTMVLIDLPFSFQNIIVMPLLFGIAVDNGIHLVHLHRSHPPASGNLLGTTTARAILFSNLTTLGSFTALAFSPHPGTRSMGLLLVIGLSFTLFCTLALLPELLGTRRPPPTHD